MTPHAERGRPSRIANGDQRAGGRRRLVLELATVGALTLVLVAVLWSAQRALFLSVFANSPAGSAQPRPDLDASRAQTTIAWITGLLLCAAFLWLMLRARALQRARLGPVALAIPGVVALGLFLLPPTLSDDAYSYLSHGYLAATPGANPYVDASSSVAQSGYGQLLLQQGWTALHPATPYGPVWTLLERTAYVLSGNDVALGVLLMKLPALLSVAVVGLLLFRFLRRNRPEDALRGCLLFVANPLVLIELAGDGHNDALVAALLLGAVVTTINRRAFPALALLALAVLVKTSALPFLIPIAVHLIARRGSLRRLVVSAALALVAAAALGVLLVAPFWRGADTLTGLRSGGTLVGWSVAGALRHAAEVGSSMTGLSLALSLQAAQGVLALLLVVGTLVASRRATSTHGLLTACAAVSLIVLLLLPISWPWYATVPAALLPLIPDGLTVVLITLLAVTSRLAAPLADAAGAGVIHLSLYSVQTFIVQTVPGSVGLVLQGLRSRGRADREPEAQIEEATR